jgi:hypothetical protein
LFAQTPGASFFRETAGCCRLADDALTDSLWNDYHSELPKVDIQCRRLGNAQVAHHDGARAVGEAPTGGDALLEDDPGPMDVFRRYEVNSGDSACRFASDSKKGQRLVNTKVGREDRFLVGGEPVAKSPMIGIGRNKQGKPRARIDDDHHGRP